MPGLNQRGPMNNGPMTGRGRGVCTGNSIPGQGFAGGGYPMGRGLGRRGCQVPGRGGSRGNGWAGNYGPWADSAPAVSTQAILPNRAAMLEVELAEIKNQLNKLTESGE